MINVREALDFLKKYAVGGNYKNSTYYILFNVPGEISNYSNDIAKAKFEELCRTGNLKLDHNSFILLNRGSITNVNMINRLTNCKSCMLSSIHIAKGVTMAVHLQLQPSVDFYFGLNCDWIDTSTAIVAYAENMSESDRCRRCYMVLLCLKSLPKELCRYILDYTERENKYSYWQFSFTPPKLLYPPPQKKAKT